MSRIGKQPVAIPDKVNVTIDNKTITVEGPEGKLSYTYHQGVDVQQEGQKLTVSVLSRDKKMRAMYGLTRALISNMVIGVTEQFAKKLEIVGVGYRTQLKGKDLELSIGKSHPVIFKQVEGVEIKVPDQTHIDIVGVDKQKVGQVAADIRALYKPEPYKGKGIRYVGEYVRSKEGKSAK